MHFQTRSGACLLALFICNAFVQSQEPSLSSKISATKNVCVSPVGKSYVEPAIAADPKDPQKLVISAQAIDSTLPVFPVVFFTDDGGKTWAEAPLPDVQQMAADHRLRRGVDTWLSFSPEGVLYLCALMMMSSREPWGEDPIFVYRSEDDGKTWTVSSILHSTSFDHPIITATGSNHLWLTAAVSTEDAFVPRNTGASDFIALYRSDDDGRTFSPRSFLGPSDLFFEPKAPLVFPDGAVLVGLTEMARWRADRKITPLNEARIWVAKSSDDGRTFHVPHLVGDIGTWDVAATAQLEADVSPTSPFRGTAYAAWNRLAGGKYNVSVARSADEGDTWSEAVVLSTPGTTSVFSALAVSPTGYVGVLWLESSPTAPNGCWNTRFAVSFDGGKSFTPAQTVSEVVSCLDTPETRRIMQMGYSGKPKPVLSSWPHAADYIGLTVDSRGNFHAAWIDARDRNFSIYTTTISVK